MNRRWRDADYRQAHPINDGLVEGRPKQWYLAIGLLVMLGVIFGLAVYIPTLSGLQP